MNRLERVKIGQTLELNKFFHRLPLKQVRRLDSRSNTKCAFKKSANAQKTLSANLTRYENVR